MTITFQMTARDMVTQAMRELAVLPSGGGPEAAEMEDGILRLNSMLKAYAAKGLNLWRDTDGSVTFPAGTASMALDPRPVTVADARIVVGDDYERILTRWEIDEYSVLPVKTQQATPVAYLITQTVAGMKMTLWPVPLVDTAIRYSYGRVTEDIVSPNDTVDIPQMFQEAVWMGLAVRLAPTYGKARTDPQTVQLVMARASELERDMLDFDRPATYQLGPDLDGYP